MKNACSQLINYIVLGRECRHFSTLGMKIVETKILTSYGSKLEKDEHKIELAFHQQKQ